MPGVDMLWLGHNDLSVALGEPGAFDHSDFVKAEQATIAAAKKHGKSAGRLAVDAKQGAQFASHGLRLRFDRGRRLAAAAGLRRRPGDGEEGQMKGKWKKSPTELIAAFDAAIAGKPGVERRQMFGYPSAFLKGNLLSGLFQDQMMVRLSEADRAKASLRSGGHAVRAGWPADARVCRAAAGDRRR